MTVPSLASSVHRLRTPDWGYVGWHYKLIHMSGGPINNRFLVRVRGIENLPPEEGFLYASNHSSWWDPIVLQTTTPRPVNWLAKKEMMNNRFNKWFFFDRGGCIPVDRKSTNPEARAAAVQALRDGRIIGVFPEGTRHVGELGPAKTGVARLALEADAPVVPAALATDKFWPPGSKVPKLSQRIYLNVGKPMRLSGDPANPEDARRATDEVMAAIRTLLDEAIAARDRAEKWPSPEAAVKRARAASGTHGDATR